MKKQKTILMMLGILALMLAGCRGGMDETEPSHSKESTVMTTGASDMFTTSATEASTAFTEPSTVNSTGASSEHTTSAAESTAGDPARRFTGIRSFRKF